MRRYLTIIIVIAITILLLSGCSAKNDNDRQYKYPKREKNTMYIYYPSIEYYRPTDDHVITWEDYMLDKYDFKLNLTYSMSLTDTFSNQTYKSSDANQTSDTPISIKQLSTLSNDEGFVYIQDFETLNQLIKYDMIIPVQNYISQIPYYAVFDQQIIDNFTDSIGNTWAFPLSILPAYTGRRIYNKDWLDKAGVAVPKTLDEFYEYAKYVSNEDPDSNGTKDSYIMQFTPTTSLRDFLDIFRAFGCYTDGIEDVCYNPQLGDYECIFLNENFMDAMVYIMFLWQENLIKCVPMKDIMANIDQAHHNASSYASNLAGTKLDNRAYGFYLLGYNETKLIELKNRELCLAVLRFTDKVPKKINDLINVIQSNPESYLDFSIGIKGVDYFDRGTYYDYQMFEEDRTSIPRIGIINWLNTSVLTKKPLVPVTSSDKLGTNTDIIPIIESRIAKSSVDQLVNEYLETNLVYSNTFEYSTPELYEINQIIGPLRTNFFKAVFEENVPLDDAYNELIRELDKKNISIRISNLKN